MGAFLRLLPLPIVLPEQSNADSRLCKRTPFQILTPRPIRYNSSATRKVRPRSVQILESQPGNPPQMRRTVNETSTYAPISSNSRLYSAVRDANHPTQARYTLRTIREASSYTSFSTTIILFQRVPHKLATPMDVATIVLKKLY